MSRTLLIFGLPLLAMACIAQQPATPPQKPQVKVNVLNVCTPSTDEQKEIAAALSAIPKRPPFSADFEIDRGRSVLDPSTNPLLAGSAPATEGLEVADFIRMRHDVGGTSQYATVQYSFSRDRKQMVETLVFRVRDPKELLQVSIEDSASAVTPASVMLASATPASRIKLERFGKPSIVLARCSSFESGRPVDQSKYEPLFSSASAAVSAYRDLLGARTLVPEELTRLGRGQAKPAVKSSPHKH